MTSAAATRAFYDEYSTVMDLPADFYLQTVHKVFLEHELPRGLFMHRDARVEPDAIERTALLEWQPGARITSAGQRLVAFDRRHQILGPVADIARADR